MGEFDSIFFNYNLMLIINLNNSYLIEIKISEAFSLKHEILYKKKKKDL